MNKWIRDITLLLVSAICLTLIILTYRNSVKPDPPAPVIEVIEVLDPELATAQMLLGQWQVQVQNLVELYEKQAALFGLTMDRLVEEIRKGNL